MISYAFRMFYCVSKYSARFSDACAKTVKSKISEKEFFIFFKTKKKKKSTIVYSWISPVTSFKDVGVLCVSRHEYSHLSFQIFSQVKFCDVTAFAQAPEGYCR